LGRNLNLDIQRAVLRLTLRKPYRGRAHELIVNAHMNAAARRDDA